MPSQSKQKAPIALTMGDPAGIGPELCLKAWKARNENNLPPFAVLADLKVLSQYADILGEDVPLKEITHISQAIEIFDTSLPVLNVKVKNEVEPGKPNSDAAKAIISSIEKAVELSSVGEASAVVTNPIAKSVLYKAGFTHPGHTEFLGELGKKLYKTEASPVMMLASSELRTVPVTIHIPLEDVPAALTYGKLIQTIKITHQDLKQYFNIQTPHIAVTGLNPHAGEDGNLGKQEQDVIIPAIKKLQSEGLNITGPYPADAIFHAAARKTYDVVIAMYHDQALIPLKTLSFDEGVNVTLGLPFIRTSPDHGTAFNIAGKGIANPTSLIHALKMAAQMAENASGNNKNDK